MTMRFFTLFRGSILRESLTFKMVCTTILLNLFFVANTYGQTNSFTVGSIIGTTGDFARNAKIADFDNDGDNDIAFYSDGANYRLYKNGGTGSFANSYTELIPFGSAGGIIEPADLDGDGDIDIVASNGRVYINNGSGTFAQLGTLLIQQNTGGGIAAIKIADINNDGKKDIIWANSSNGTNAYNEVWLNTGSTGNAAFTYSTGFASTQSGKSSLDVADIDADGDLDVVLGVSNGSAEVFKNSGGTFSLFSVSGAYSANVYLRDWDKDGDLDLLTWSSYNSFGLRVFLNNGSGTFGSLYYTSPISGNTIDIGDINGDGYIDAILGTGTSTPLSVLTNNGCGLVTQSFTINPAPHGAILGDVSGDGKLDIFIMSRYSTTTNQSRVYLNDLSLLSIITAPGNALNFDGTDDYVSIPDANTLDLTSSYTIEAWIKPSSFSAAAGIVSKYHSVNSNGYLLRLAGTAPYTGINFDGLETATGILQADRWYHIAAVKSGSNRTLYINGVSVAMPNGNAITTAANTDVLAIGVDYLASPRYFNGSIDEVRIWNVARTSTEINNNRNAVVNACSVSSLVAYYKCDNGTASGSNTSYYALNDLSTNNNHGILTNFALTGTSSNWIVSTAFGNTWLGTTSNAFSTTTNWSFGTVPTVAENVVIPTGASNLPVNISSTQSINNLEVQSGASLTVTVTGTIKIGGSITNNGILTATSGTVELNGSIAQTLPANTFSSNTVQNLTINNSAGVTLGGALNLTGVLTPTAGTLVTGGNLTLVSTDINGGGAIGQGSNSGGYISGTVNVQRYTQAQRGYRTLAHPYTTGQPLSLLTNTIRITGLDTANGTYGTTLSGGNPSAFYYNPLKPSGDASVLEPITSPTSTAKWQPANAIFLFVRGNGNEGASGPGIGSYGGSIISPVTLTAANGTINQGDVTVPLLYGDATTDNYNLIGNPYPCPINLKNLVGLPLGTVYVYNPTKNIAIGSPYSIAGGFDTYTHNGSNNIIVPNMGAFYIKVTATGQSLVFKETDKTTALTPSYATFGVTKNQLLQLVIKNNNGIIDNLKIGYNNTSTGNATDTYDATKKANSLLDFYSLSTDKQQLAVDYRSDKLTDNVIPLGIKTLLTGIYNISAAVITDLPNTQFVLHDKLLNKETLLVAGADGYSFNISSDTATKGNNRFEISVLGTGVLPTTISSITAKLITNNKATVNWVSATEVNADYYQLQRSADGISFVNIAKIAATGTGGYSHIDDLSILSSVPKIIYYRLQMVDKDGSKAYSKIVMVIPTSNIKSGLSVYPNPVKSTLYAEVISTVAGKATLSITDAHGKVVLKQIENVNAGSTAIALPASQLAAGYYTLMVITNDGKQQQQFIKN